MIKALLDSDGGQLLVLGVTAADINKMVAGLPLLIEPGFIGELPTLSIALCAGPDHDAIIRDIESNLGVTLPVEAKRDASGG